MPLVKDDSSEAVSRNIKILEEEGKKTKQAVAIALEVARQAKKTTKDNASKTH